RVQAPEVALREAGPIADAQRRPVLCLGATEVRGGLVAPSGLHELLGPHRLELGDPGRDLTGRAGAGDLARPVGVHDRSVDLAGVAIPLRDLQPLLVEPGVP